jgi:hypothetical protein
MKLADYLEAPSNTTKQPTKPVDIYQSMTPQEAITNVDTYDKAKDYVLTHIKYEDHEGRRSFEETHSLGKGICLDGAQAAMSLLSDNTNNYFVSLMVLRAKTTNDPDHAVALVFDKEINRFGTAGINKRDCIKPQYRTISEAYNQVNKNFSNQFVPDSCEFLLSKGPKIDFLEYSLSAQNP